MTKPLLAILLLLPLSVSADELQGKAIQCFANSRSDVTLEDVDFIDRKMWHFRFLQNSGVVLDNIELVGQELKLEKHANDPASYVLYFNHISIWDVWQVDRRTLVLTSIVSDEKYNCEVFDSHDEYFVDMGELIGRLEKLIEVRQSENQI